MKYTICVKEEHSVKSGYDVVPVVTTDKHETNNFFDMLEMYNPYITLACEQSGTPYSVITKKLAFLLKGQGVMFKCRINYNNILNSAPNFKKSKTPKAKTREELAEIEQPKITNDPVSREYKEYDNANDWGWKVLTIYIAVTE